MNLPRIRRVAPVTASVVAMLVLGLAACDDDANDATDSTTGTSTPDAANTIDDSDDTTEDTDDTAGTAALTPEADPISRPSARMAGAVTLSTVRPRSGFVMNRAV